MPKPNKYLPQDLDIEEDYEESAEWRETPVVPPPSLWGCVFCTFDNLDSAEACVVCQQPRLAPSVSEEAPVIEHIEDQPEFASLVWPCDFCTFENESGAMTCKMCGGGVGYDEDADPWVSSQVKFRFKSSRKPLRKPGNKPLPAAMEATPPQSVKTPVRFVVERWTQEEENEYKGGASAKLAQINWQSVFGLILSTELVDCASVCKSWHHVLCGPRSVVWKDRYNSRVRGSFTAVQGITPSNLLPADGQAWARLFGLHYMKQGNRVDCSMWFPKQEAVDLFSCTSPGSSSLSLVGALTSAGEIKLWSARLRAMKNHKSLAYSTPAVTTLKPPVVESPGSSFISGSVCLEVNRAAACSSRRVLLWDISLIEHHADKCFAEAVEMKGTKPLETKVVYDMASTRNKETEEGQWWAEQGYISFCQLCPLPVLEFVPPTLNVEQSTTPAKQQPEQQQQQQQQQPEQQQPEQQQPEQQQPEQPQEPEEQNTTDETELASSPKEEWVLVEPPKTPTNLTTSTTTTNVTATIPIGITTAPPTLTDTSPSLVTVHLSSNQPNGETAIMNAGEEQKIDVENVKNVDNKIDQIIEQKPTTEKLEEIQQTETQEEKVTDCEEEGDSEEENEGKEEEEKQERQSRPFQPTKRESKRRGLLVVGFHSGQAELRNADKGQLIARLSFGAGKVPTPKFTHFTFQLEYPLLVRHDDSNVMVVNLEAALARAARLEEAEKLSAATPAITPNSPVLTHLVAGCPSKITHCNLWKEATGQTKLITCHQDGNIFLWCLEGGSKQIFCVSSPPIGCVHVSNTLGVLVVDTPNCHTVYVFDLTNPNNWATPLAIPTSLGRYKSIEGLGFLRHMHADRDFLILQGREGLWIYIWQSRILQCISTEATLVQVCGSTVIAAVPGYVQVHNLLSRARLIKLELTPVASTTSTYIPLIPATNQKKLAVQPYVDRQNKKSELLKARQAKEKLVYKAQNRARDSKYIDEY